MYNYQYKINDIIKESQKLHPQFSILLGKMSLAQQLSLFLSLSTYNWKSIREGLIRSECTVVNVFFSDTCFIKILRIRDFVANRCVKFA